ncbi:hypothetical protein EI008_25955, partial [Escherichia coli]|nr:hypothetical protein [Escherichia coli]
MLLFENTALFVIKKLGGFLFLVTFLCCKHGSFSLSHLCWWLLLLNWWTWLWFLLDWSFLFGGFWLFLFSSSIFGGGFLLLDLLGQGLFYFLLLFTGKHFLFV